MIQVEECLKIVRYYNGKTTINDKLAELLNANSNDIDFSQWRNEISVTGASSTIKVSENENSFLVEGFDNLYFVSFENQVQWLSKDELFKEAGQHIIDDVLVSANQDGYDTSDSSCHKSMLNVAVMVMKSYFGKEPIRIPYLLKIDLGKTPIGFNYNRMPMFYTINNDGLQTILDAISNTIKTKFQLNPTEASLPLYTFNGLLSKITLQ